MKTLHRRLILCLVLVIALTAPLWSRDWTKDPPWIEVKFSPKVVAVGDIHGAWPQMAASLEAVGVAKRVPDQESRLVWTGGTSVLIFTGDYGDRGDYTHEVYDSVMDLEAQAQKAGGKVIPLLGNHEVLLLNGTVEKWARELKPPKQQHYQNTIDSFNKTGVEFHKAIAADGKYGAWIRRRPLFAIVNGWLFIHGGLSDPGQSRSDLAADYREAVEGEKWNGKILMGEKTVLWNRKWWEDDPLVRGDLQLMGVRGVVFGHTICALGAEGKIGIKNAKMINIDVGMCPAIGKGEPAGLSIAADNRGSMTFQACYGDGSKVELLKIR